MVGGDGFNLHPAFVFLAPFHLKELNFQKSFFKKGSYKGMCLFCLVLIVLHFPLSCIIISSANDVFRIKEVNVPRLRDRITKLSTSTKFIKCNAVHISTSPAITQNRFYRLTFCQSVCKCYFHRQKIMSYLSFFTNSLNAVRKVSNLTTLGVGVLIALAWSCTQLEHSVIPFSISLYKSGLYFIFPILFV